MPVKRHQGRHERGLVRAHRGDGVAIGKGAVLDRIDAGAGRGGDAAAPWAWAATFRPERMGGGDDGAHLLVGEMRLEPARLLREDAAGGGELDDVGAAAGEFAHAGGAFGRPGAGVVAAAGRVRPRGRKPLTSPWPPMIDTGPGPSDDRAALRSALGVPRRSAKIDSAAEPRSRTVVKPARR
jgi:hypothetical protein